MKKQTTSKPKQNRFRIIAGEYRGRFLPFPDVEGLRPTPDRVRETLFNWLQNDIVDAFCLDAFAGSGALSIEALSRGASQLVSIDSSAVAIASIRSSSSLLGCDALEAINQDSLKWLHTESARRGAITEASKQDKENASRPFDIIFLDPPYSLALLPTLIDTISQSTLLKPGGLVYLEDNKPLSALDLPETWTLLRDKKAGQVYYGLCQSDP